ncbi:MAG: hypothetical protein PHV20_02590 [Bacteroidales bacterium]|nr:hypothetical protein [Bacteroidales bacterium]
MTIVENGELAEKSIDEGVDKIKNIIDMYLESAKETINKCEKQ